MYINTCTGDLYGYSDARREKVPCEYRGIQAKKPFPERIDGEKVLLKIYPVNQQGGTCDSVWVFEKAED